MTTRTRLVLVGLAIAVAVAAFAIAKSGSDDNGKSSTTPPARPAVTHIRVVGGKPAGGVTRITVGKGDPVRFSVTSDVADEIHVHGYDYHKDVERGGTVSFAFKAKFDGAFEIELEGRKEQIAELRVEP